MSKNNVDGIPYRTIKRLPQYRAALADALEAGHTRISSSQLAGVCNVTASQLRQDLSYFGSFGQQGYGYDTEVLLTSIDRILGIDQNSPMILVGVGRLGRSLLSYPGFAGKGFQFVYAFDSNPELFGMQLDGVPVYDVSELEQRLADQAIDIAVLTVPKEAAQSTAELLVAAGVRGIMNFAPIQLHLPSYVVVENVHFSHSLLTLAFQLKPRRPVTL